MRGDPEVYDAGDIAVGLARTLRAAGVEAGPQRVHAFVQALGKLDPRSRQHVYWAGRLTLCGAAADFDRYDRVFAAYFAGSVPAPARPEPAAGGLHLVEAAAADDGPGLDDAGAPADSTRLAASRVEVLRRRDLASMTDEERTEVLRLLATLRLVGDPRRSRRHRPSSRGTVDRQRTLRRLLHAGGEPVRPAHSRSQRRARRVVVLVDVSGSMRSYADALVRFAHAASRRAVGPPTEVFTMGTRLTRVTRELGQRDPEAAMRALAAAVPDWSGGTRLGPLLKEFLDVWGQRGIARGAVVVVLSDGWERGEVAVLAEQMARLHRLAHRVVWANPRAGREGFTPAAAGMAAALPHVDNLVAGHSIAALERLARVVAGVTTPELSHA